MTVINDKLVLPSHWWWLYIARVKISDSFSEPQFHGVSWVSTKSPCSRDDFQDAVPDGHPGQHLLPVCISSILQPSTHTQCGWVHMPVPLCWLVLSSHICRCEADTYVQHPAPVTVHMLIHFHKPELCLLCCRSVNRLTSVGILHCVSSRLQYNSHHNRQPSPLIVPLVRNPWIMASLFCFHTEITE